MVLQCAWHRRLALPLNECKAQWWEFGEGVRGNSFTREGEFLKHSSDPLISKAEEKVSLPNAGNKMVIKILANIPVRGQETDPSTSQRDYVPGSLPCLAQGRPPSQG